MRPRVFNRNESGSTTAEFAVVAGVFFMLIFGIIEFGRLFYTHNALTDAARRGARYAVLHEQNAQSLKCIKNVAVYGETHISAYPNCDPPAGQPSLINGLASANILVIYDGGYKTDTGSVTVTIQNYTFDLSIPLFGRTLNMPAYSTTLTAESAGEVPGDI